MWASLNVSSTNVCPLSLAYNSNSPLDAIPEWIRKAFDRKCYSPNMKCSPQVYVMGYPFSSWGRWFWRLHNLLDMGLTLRGCVSLKATDYLHFLKSYFVSTLSHRPSCSSLLVNAFPTMNGLYFSELWANTNPGSHQMFLSSILSQWF